MELKNKINQELFLIYNEEFLICVEPKIKLYFQEIINFMKILNYLKIT